MGDANVCLFRPTQIGLRNKYVTHAQHSQTAQFFWCVEHHGRESRGHFGIQTDLDTGLNFILAFDQQIEQLLGVNDGFAEVRHQTDQRCVPFVDDFCECCRTRCHQNLTNTIMETSQRLVIYAQETLGGSFFRYFIL